MAALSLGETKWRMLRRALRKKRFGYAGAQNMSRADPEHFNWVVAGGFVVPAGDGVYEITEKGKLAADLGLSEV